MGLFCLTWFLNYINTSTLNLALNKPYPFISNSYRVALFKALIIALLSVFFLYNFDNDGEALEHFVIEACLIAASQFICLFALPKQFLKKHDLRLIPIWQYILWLMLCIFVGYSLIYCYLGIIEYKMPISIRGLVIFSICQLSIALIIIIMIIGIDYVFLLKQELSTITQINNQIIHHKQTIEAENITNIEAPTQNIKLDFIINDEQNKKVLTLKKSNLLFIKGADNYIEIYFINEQGTIHKELVRNTLSNIESDFENDFLTRVHRSYLCNLFKVNKLKGNSRGYELQFAETGETIPVSRAKSDEVTKKLDQLFEK